MGLYDKTLGPLLIGIFFNTFLYGLVTFQFAVYYRTKFNDRPATKYTVLFLFIVDTFHSVAVIYMAWYYAVENYNNPVVLKAVKVGVWPYPFTAIEIAIVATVTQIYLGHRIWRLTNSKILYGIVIALAVPSCILGFVAGITAWIIHVHANLLRILPLHVTWLTISVVLDCFITVTLVIVFTRSRARFRRMDAILNRLIRGAIQTGLFASIFALGDLITFIVLPKDNFYGMFAVPLGRIYTNTLLDTLLTRESLKGHMNGTEHVMGEPNSLDWRSTDPSQVISMSHTSSNHGAAESHSASEGVEHKAISLVV